MTSQLLTTIRRVAGVVLEYLPKVSEAAKRDLHSLRKRGYSGDIQVDEQLIKIREHRENGLKHIAQEPFYAYIKAQSDSDGKEQIYLVMRPSTTPNGFSGDIALCSYLAPAGRIAELEVGDSVELPNGEDMISVEKNLFKPIWNNANWDGINNHFQIVGGEEPILSLRGLSDSSLATLELPADAIADTQPDIIAQIKAIEEQMAAEREKANRRRRAIIDSGALRDQPILDSSQGGIFRKPLNSVIAVTGAPGTGKTTLLIKRLAQKTNIDYLTEDERALIKADNPEHQKLFHPKNWTLFVPSEGLRDYLKGAMAGEMIPADAETVKVWDTRSMEIARDVFGYIGPDKIFVYKRDQAILSALSSEQITACAYEFGKWHEAEIIRILQNAKEQAASAGHNTILLSRLQEVQSGDAFGILRQAETMRDDFRKRNAQKEKLADILTFSALTTPDIINKVAEIFPAAEPDNAADDDNKEEFNNADVAGREDERIRAKRIIGQTILRHACGEMGKGAAGEKARKLWALIEPALARHRDIMPELAEFAVEQKIFAPLAGGFRNYLNRIPSYYRRFRRHKLRQGDMDFFHSAIDAEKTIGNNEISADEVDIVNFVMLKNADKLVSAGRAQNNNIIKHIATKRKTQIAADEATDFSAVQLGCMYYLSHPYFRSLTMVGDLRQRLTARGIQNFDECKMFAPALGEYAVKKAYRQSPRLTELAAKLYRKFIGKEPPFAAAYQETDKGAELLLHFAAEDKDAAKWVADKILGIYNIYSELPAIAVFTLDKPQAQKMANSLTDLLEQNAINVYPCLDGKMTASNEGVHIIPVQFVKGLEFEGVFFVGLDDIAREKEQAAERYLYVGVTRAAQFLAVVCRKEFPARLSCVRADFVENGKWE